MKVVILMSLVAAAAALRQIKDCDVVIVGGSLSALAAALTAVNTSIHSPHASSKTHTCLLEPTDWAGGQLTSSNVPPDFGEENSISENLAQSFDELLLNMTGTWWNNPGACWVSYKCFEAQKAAAFITDKLAQLEEHLSVYYNTVVTSSSLDASSGRVMSIRAVQRTAISPYSGWSHTLSQDLLDWYSPVDSAYFSKQELEFAGFAVAIDASEFGDVLMTSGLTVESVAQGMEEPDEDSIALDSTCGQSTVYPFHIQYYDSPVDAADIAAVPAGASGPEPFSLQGLEWVTVWTYRRTRAVGVNESDAGMYTIAPGEVSNQNLDNDYPTGYLFTELEAAMAEARAGRWAGGINLTTLYSTEQRAFGWFHYFIEQAPAEIRPYLGLTKEQAGTDHGLSKTPYLRESRRSRRGLGGFRLTYADLNYSNPEDGGQTARHFADTVAIGVYIYADVHQLKPGSCPKPYPSYVSSSHPINPYYIPFRALTVAASPNLLVSGKGMAQTFLANAGTRLHPTEWSSGVAAGAAAVLMATQSWSSSDMLEKVSMLQHELRQPYINSPLTWTPLPPTTRAMAAQKSRGILLLRKK